MHRLVPASLLLGILLVGCAAPRAQTESQGAPSRVDELANSQARLELRIDEVTRSLLALRKRLDAQEQALQQLEQNLAKQEEAPALQVVRLAPGVQPEQESEPAGGAVAADLYRRAFNAYREKRYGQAILDFEDFLRSHPDHEYADNAQYWIGESYYSQGQYEQAVIEFNRVLERYPQEAKAPDALLKIGNSYDQTGDREKARLFWERLVGQYPQSEAARQARKLLSASP